MYSLSNLNSYSNTGISYTDFRTPAITIFGEVASQSVTVNEDTPFNAPPGILVDEFINLSNANVVYSVNVSSVANTTVTWTSLPANVTSNSSAGVYFVSGITSKAKWESVQSPTITMPADYANSWSYTSKITVDGFDVYNWLTSVTVIPQPELSEPSDFFYTANTTQVITGVPTIVDTSSNAYLLTCNISNVTVSGNLSSTGTGGNVSFNSNTKIYTIQGTRNQINSHLANLTTVNGAFTDTDYFITYSLFNNTSGQTTTKIQSINSDSTLIMSRANIFFYQEDITANISGNPIINDPSGSLGNVFTVNVSPYSANTVSLIFPNISTGANVQWNNTIKRLTITGNKTQVNNTLGNLAVTPFPDYANDIYLEYKVLSETFLSEGDPSYNSVELLLQANDSTQGNIKDNSSNNYSPVVTANNNSSRVLVSNAQAKWGTKSFYFNGANASITYDSVTNTNLLLPSTSDFTWEAWIYPTAQAPYATLIGYRSNSAGPDSGALLLYTNQDLNYNWILELDSDEGPYGFAQYNLGVGAEIGQWQHMAVVRSGSQVLVYKNGQQIGNSIYFPSSIVMTDNYLNIGSFRSDMSYGGGNYFIGYMDDIRYTNGVARYITNFTPPTARFLTTQVVEIPIGNVVTSRLQQGVCSVANDEITNMDITRNFVQNTPDIIFPTSVPQIADVSANTTIYTITLSSGAGKFGLADFGTNGPASTFSYTGTKQNINSIMNTIKFYPNRDFFGSATFTYTQRNVTAGGNPITVTGGLVGTERTTPLPDQGTIVFTSSGSLTLTYTQANYLNKDVLVVGGGGGGAYYGGGGGGGAVVEQINNQTAVSAGVSYPVTVGAGGVGTKRSGTAAGSGGSSSVFGIGASGGSGTAAYGYAGATSGTGRTGGSGIPFSIGGGGGGSSSNGGNASTLSGTNQYKGGNGGNGTFSTVLNTTFGGGGGGYSQNNQNQFGLGGTGNGGRGGNNTTPAVLPTVSGGGGNGAGPYGTNNEGAAGIVAIKFYR